MRARWLLLLVLGPAYLIPRVESGGFTVSRPQLERADEQIRRRASFEMRCPGDQLHLVVLAVDKSLFGPDDIRQVVVFGCGRKRVYVHANGKWMPRSDSR